MRTALFDLPYPLTLSRKGAWTLVPTAANCTGSLLHCAHSTASCCSFEKSFRCCAVRCKHSSVCVCVCACVCVCVCVSVCVSVCVTPTAAQGRVTSPWCGGETGGGSPGLTRNLGGDLVQPRRPGHGIPRPTPRRPPWDSHDGTGRAPPGGGGMQESPGSPCGPALSRAHLFPPLAPTHGAVCLCTGTSWVGTEYRNAIPGLGLNSMPRTAATRNFAHRDRGRVPRLPLRCSLRRG